MSVIINYKTSKIKQTKFKRPIYFICTSTIWLQVNQFRLLFRCRTKMSTFALNNGYRRSKSQNTTVKPVYNWD